MHRDENVDALEKKCTRQSVGKVPLSTECFCFERSASRESLHEATTFELDIRLGRVSEERSAKVT